MSNPFIDRWRGIISKISKQQEEEGEKATESVASPSRQQAQDSTSISASAPIPALSSRRSDQISVRLATWIETKGYRCKDVTIESLSAAIYTNRTYLSKYINSLYGCSFKVWVTKLRIDEAKRMLCDTHESSVSQISEQVGFSSPTSFIHVFKKYESIPPAKWREKHREFKAALMDICDDDCDDGDDESAL